MARAQPLTLGDRPPRNTQRKSASIGRENKNRPFHRYVPRSQRYRNNNASQIGCRREHTATDCPMALHKVQRLLVEGGANTLQRFIDAELWDEAYIETAPIKLGKGVTAPHIRNEHKKETFDCFGHQINYFSHKNSPFYSSFNIKQRIL